ncbi:hypothetical protein K1X84_10065 [bacterium]|nr:hypothetical protein [bacterium]
MKSKLQNHFSGQIAKKIIKHKIGVEAIEVHGFMLRLEFEFIEQPVDLKIYHTLKSDIQEVVKKNSGFFIGLEVANIADSFFSQELFCDDSHISALKSAIEIDRKILFTFQKGIAYKIGIAYGKIVVGNLQKFDDNVFVAGGARTKAGYIVSQFLQSDSANILVDLNTRDELINLHNIAFEEAGKIKLPGSVDISVFGLRMLG